MITVTLYSRPECHLCEQAKEDLAALQEKIPHRLVEINIESDPQLHKTYLTEIPVVEAGPYRLKAPFSRQALEMTLGAAADRMSHLERIGDDSYRSAVKRGQTITTSDRIYFWLSKHYMLLVNLLLALYLGLPFLAPALMKAGAEGPAQVIYKIYSPLCHQFGFRSFFLFGEQWAYPRSAAEVNGLRTWGQATGLSELDTNEARLAARAYTGDEEVGFKVALCERDVAIYASMLLFGLIFAASGNRLRGLHWGLWILIGILPVGLDGFSQLFSQLGLPLVNALLPYRESTPLLRLLTGSLFGFTTAWFGFPPMEESMRETRQFLIKKFAVIGQGN
jgi:uncharacterized membrane protein